MTPLTIEFKNYKLLNEKFDFPQEGNVYLVVGSNNKGKSSFVQGFLDILEAKNNTKVPVTNGEKEGEIILEIEDDRGNPFIAKFEFTNEDAKFTLITPEGISTKKVTDIRNFFGYTSITAEEFVKLGNNEKDKKKQRDLFLSMMSPENVKTFENMESLLLSDFTKRTELGREVKALEGSIVSAISDQDKELLTKKEALLKERDNIRIKKEKKSEIDQEYSHFQLQADVTKREVSNITDEINHLQEALKKAQEELKTKTEHLVSLENKLANKPSIEFDLDRLQEVETLIDRINEVAGKANAYKDNEERLKGKKEEHKDLSKRIEDGRIALQKHMEDHAPKVDNIRIGADGLRYVDEDLDVPFEENQVGTSRIYLITAKILMALNKKTPIIFLGRAESLDMESINEIAKMADEMNAKVVLDRVLPNESNIQLIGIEQLNETLKENLK